MRIPTVILVAVSLLVGGCTTFERDNPGDPNSVIGPPHNSPPDEPSNPFPGNGQVDVPLSVAKLSWDCADPEGDAVEYRVYFGDNEQPAPRVDHWLPSAEFTLIKNLTAGTWYYWRIEARDEHGLVSEGPLWEFRTRDPLVQ
jgi:hypothetical protein